MTISSTTNRAQFNCDGSTTSFPFTFRYLEASDLQVYLASPTGTVTLLTLNVDYQITPAIPGPGGTLSFLGGYLSSPPGSGYTLTILRFVPRTQEVDFRNGDALDEENIEGMGDKLTMMVQDLDERIGRAVTAPPSSSLSGIQLPTPEAGKFIRWNSVPDNLENATIADASVQVINEFWTDNLLINGDAQVVQKSPITLDSGIRYGAVDRWIIFFSSSSGSPTGSGTYAAGMANLSSTRSIAVTGAGCSNTNTLCFGQRVESVISQHVQYALTAGRKLSLQFKLHHDIGSSCTVSAQVSTANAADNFSSTTNRWSSGTITSIPSGSWTTVKVEGFSPTNTDFDKGFVLYIGLDTPAGMSGKSIYIGDIQLEIGERCTEFDYRPFHIEFALCQRYYQTGNCGFRHYNVSGGGVSSEIAFGWNLNFPTPMRATPTINISAGARALINSVAPQHYWYGGFQPQYYVSSNGDAYAYDSYTANAEL